MEFIMILFVFLLPLASLVMSLYSFFIVNTYKKAAVKKLAAFKRLSGEDTTNE